MRVTGKDDNPVVYPNADIAANAQVGPYQALYERSMRDPEGFWDEAARELTWYQPWDRVLDASDAPFYKWFPGASLNMVCNALERHIEAGKGRHTAIAWEGESGERKTLSYSELDREVSGFGAVLGDLGIRQGDRVAIYMPRIPEQVVAMLACAKIGAVHTVIFGGLATEALHSRIVDSGARLLVTADGGFQNGKTIELKSISDRALKGTDCVEHVVVVRRTGESVDWVAGRDHWWHELMASDVAKKACPSVHLDAEHPFFIIYTSGSTGIPKGLLHTLGGFSVDVYALLKWVLDLKESDVLFCTSDAGWLVGHTIMIYGALMHGITTVIYEGAPAYPKPDRWWEIIERYGVTVFYTSPTAARSLRRFGDELPQAHDLGSLRLISIAGEPFDSKTWFWVYEMLGGGRCPVIDSWWQTETARPMISSLPNLPVKPGSCGLAMPGVGLEIVDQEGEPVATNSSGLLLLTTPWPGIARTIFGAPERFRSQYWERFPGRYLTGDLARMDEDGYVWVIGRADDIIKVSGYRLGTGEIEAALISHEDVAEAAVVGLPHDVRGNVIHGFVVLRQGCSDHTGFGEELRQQVAQRVGPIAKPEGFTFLTKLPKTRSGKIVRRILRAQALGEPIGDTSTLEEQ